MSAKTLPVKTFDDLTPAWLTDVLLAQGSLVSGRVEYVEQKRDPNPVTHNATLHLRYSSDARGSLPSKLFFKQDQRTSEAKFYKEVAPMLTEVVVPRCYDAQFGDANSHVLLDYIERTHFTPSEILPVSRFHHESVVDTLANVHGQFWGDVHFNKVGNLATDIPGFTLSVASQHFTAFVDYLGDRLSSRRRGYFERILGQFPKHRSATPKTLVHGDAHFWNFLYPYDTAEPLYLLDWAMWHINVGVSDVAFSIALQCYPQHRTEIEKPLVRRYHERLLEKGVGHYAWAQCWEDYRRTVMDQCLLAIQWQHFGLPASVWWFALECSISAFEDLACEEFL
jgi:hypothetical protein